MAKESVEVHARAVIADNDLTRSRRHSFELDHDGRRICGVSVLDQLGDGQHIVAYELRTYELQQPGTWPELNNA
jgi:hypothetical protein